MPLYFLSSSKSSDTSQPSGNHCSYNSYISSPSVTLEIINKYGVNLKKRWGQNFLIDTNVAKKIVRHAHLKENDTVLEIGSGIGGLTEIMLQNVRKIVCIELDNLLVKIFSDIFSGEIGKKIELIHADALKIDYWELNARHTPNKIVSNLPYCIASPLILKLLLEAKGIDFMIVTIQKDIADRLVSSPGSKDYNSYTVKANFLGQFDILFMVSRNCFIPRPNVDSVVVKITKKDSNNMVEKLMEGIKGEKKESVRETEWRRKQELRGMEKNEEKNELKEIEKFFNFIDTCFSQRRKKLINTLARSFTWLKEKESFVLQTLSSIGKNQNVRAEELSLEDYIFLYRNLFI
ncbi:MAG: ribosomal RNA small subunit methyltransferase A [Actinobacteria bacterium]|nr:ribosomal RNA small subunit methyltransferase A [Actinomycetota bacterium]